MHIVATDVLACPRCGGEFGLIVLADEMDGRRVVTGRFGCANCREEYPVAGGVADLRDRAGPQSGALEGGDADRALRVAALLGIGTGPGPVVVHGASAALVGEIAGLLPDALVLAASGEAPEGGAVAGGWMLVGGRFPVRSGTLRGLALLGPVPPALLADAPRVLARGARVVLDPAAPEDVRRLVGAGLDLLLDQEGVAVASRGAPG